VAPNSSSTQPSVTPTIARPVVGVVGCGRDVRGRTVHDGDQATAYAAAMTSLAAEAWYDEARQLILRVMDELRRAL
jgi:hypothetical protein